MNRTQERDAFVAALAQAFPDKPYHQVARVATLLMRHAKTHGNVAEAECNGPGDYVNRIPYPEAGKIYERHQAWCEKRTAQLERRMTEICKEIGIEPSFGGDPRGYTVAVKLPTNVYNTWGGQESGYGIPQ